MIKSLGHPEIMIYCAGKRLDADEVFCCSKLGFILSDSVAPSSFFNMNVCCLVVCSVNSSINLVFMSDPLHWQKEPEATFKIGLHCETVSHTFFTL